MPATRQLAAILFADIQGYTALMQEDEVKAMTARGKFQKALTNEIKARNGHIIQLSGDGAFCIFKSAIEAIHAAIEIQKQMREEPNVPLRIGIHSGDVITEGKNVYGDGVNIASRIETFAVPGSVFISGRVYDDIKNQKDIEAVSLGKFDLKNVSTPLEIFAISNSGLVVPSKQKLEGKGRIVSKRKISSKGNLATLVGAVLILSAAFFFYNKYFVAAKFTGKEKSIAVLPFFNMSGDKSYEYFTDGITEDIISRLSQIADLRVISRTSVMKYKNTNKSVKEIASDLGVAAILEGSIQKNENKVRISARLIDAATDERLWSEEYDRELKDIFQIQSDVSEWIALSLNTSLTQFQKSRIEKKPTENLEAYNLYLQGNYLWNKHSNESLRQAITLYNQAVALDSNFAAAYAAIAISWFSHSVLTDSINEIMDKCAHRAVEIDPNLAIAHTALGECYDAKNNDLAAAIEEFTKAIQLDPNYAHAYTQKGYAYYHNGEIERALPYVSKALTLDPLTVERNSDKAEVLAAGGKSSEALEWMRKAERLEPNSNSLPYQRLLVYFYTGNYDEWLAQAKSYGDNKWINRYDFLFNHYNYQAVQAVYYAIKGNKTKSALMIDSCHASVDWYGNLLDVVCDYLLNDKEKAFEELRLSLSKLPAEKKTERLEMLLTLHFLKPLRDDPGFEHLKKDLGWKPLP